MIEQKVGELGRFLTGKSPKLDFVEPAPKLERQDDRETRAKVPALTASQAKHKGIAKSTLHYLRKNAASDRAFRTYHKVNEKLERVLGA